MLDKAYWKDISKKIIVTGKELGFNDVGISDTVINQNQGLYKEWIDAKNHGAMSYLEDHQDIKFDPENILANTKSIISVRLDCTHRTALLHRSAFADRLVPRRSSQRQSTPDT